jgi:hypothetical protein
MPKKKLSRLFGANLAVAIVVVMAFAQTAGAFTGEMKNEGSGLCMSSNGTHTNGMSAEQESCNGSANQSWVATTEALGGVQVSNDGDHWCLTNAQGAAFDGNAQTMWPCSPGIYFKDQYVPSGGGPGGGFKLAADATNLTPNGYCVTSNGATSINSGVVEHSCNTSPNQYWSGPVPNL